MPSELIATDDCERGRAERGSERAARHVGHQQFHCGNPPPAAVPSRMTCTWKSAEGPLSRALGVSPAAYRVATYAVTSIVTATISASGLVQRMVAPVL